MARDTRPLGAYVAGVVVPSTVSDAVRPLVVDTLAVTLAARRTPDSAVFHRWVSGLSMHGGPATSWTRGSRWPVDLAAHLNAADGHVLEYDDSHAGIRLHPSVILLPALLALAEARGLHVDQTAEAYAVGYEVMWALAEHHLEEQYRRGWHITTTLGALGATAACARLLGLDAARVGAAIGFAGGELGASRVNFGSLGKPYQVGAVAAGVVRATLLAEAGGTSGDLLGDARLGLGAMYGGGGQGLHAPDGRSWAIVERAPTLKHVPACFGVHHGVAAVEAILDELAESDVDQIESVEITTNPTGLIPLTTELPTTATQARFNMAYALTCLLRSRRVTLADFTDDGFVARRNDPLLRTITAEEGVARPAPRWAHARVTLADGRVLDGDAEALPAVTRESLVAKADDCLGFAGVSNASGADLVAMVDDTWTRPVADLVARVGALAS